MDWLVTSLTAGLLALLLVALSIRISMLRMRHRVSLGDGGHDDLQRAIRAHGNTAEHAPIFILLLLLAEAGNAPMAIIWTLAIVFVAARVMLVTGLLSSALSKRRRIGAGLTYACQLFVAGIVIGRVIGTLA